MSTRLLIPPALVLAAVALCNAQTSPHGKINIACEDCHTTDSWKMRDDPAFSHATTGFSLEGRHKSVACISCHKELKFPRTEGRCASCHVDVHRSELGANCIRCHTQQSWKITDMIQRHQTTRFPLLGRHASIDCQDCHATTTPHQYVDTPVECIGCHRADYESSSNPNHKAAGFSTNCIQCHRANATQWGTGFDHALTGFGLTGAHLLTPCVRCHTTPSFQNTPMLCYSCHQTNYQSATDPNHALAGFPTICQTCHTTSAWKPSVFSHDNTKFPLTGAHRAVVCQDCHVNNQYSSLSTTCVSCHQTAFANTTNPNHLTSGFPQACEQCHTTTSWSPATFDHDKQYFKIYSGEHRGRWTLCTDCHSNPASYAVFSCINCHEHSQSNTDGHHRNVSGYVYSATSCYSCHKGV